MQPIIEALEDLKQTLRSLDPDSVSGSEAAAAAEELAGLSETLAAAGARLTAAANPQIRNEATHDLDR